MSRERRLSTFVACSTLATEAAASVGSSVKDLKGGIATGAMDAVPRVRVQVPSVSTSLGTTPNSSWVLRSPSSRRRMVWVL